MESSDAETGSEARRKKVVRIPPRGAGGVFGRSARGPEAQDIQRMSAISRERKAEESQETAASRFDGRHGARQTVIAVCCRSAINSPRETASGKTQEGQEGQEEVSKEPAQAGFLFLATSALGAGSRRYEKMRVVFSTFNWVEAQGVVERSLRTT